MKYFALLVVLLVLSPCSAQHIEEEHIDEFTGNSVRRTSWIKFLDRWSGRTSYLRMTKINNNYYLDFKLIDNGDVFAIGDGDAFMLKLSNDSIVDLRHNGHEVTCLGCGSIGLWASEAYGISVSYHINPDQLKLLQAYFAVKVRIYTTEGYIEDNLREKDQRELRNCAHLVQKGSKK